LSDLQNKWNKQQKPGITDKINDTFNPKGALKPKIQNGIKKL